MLDAKNTVNLTCGLVADPEMPVETIAKFRVGVDYAASDKDSDNNSGFFDVTYYLNDGSSNAEWVKRQISDGKLGKGSQVQVLGRLVQERWKTTEGNRSKVVIVAESMTYASTNRKQNDDASTATAGAPVVQSASTYEAPDEF